MRTIKLIALFIFCMANLEIQAQTIIWNKTVDSLKNSSSTDNSSITAKRIQNDNILLVRQYGINYATSTSYKQPRYDSLKIDKYTLDGQKKWSKKYPLTGSGYVSDYIETTDKHILLLIDLGINNSVVKLDSNGNIILIKNFLNTDSLLQLTKIVDAKDGNFLILSKRSVYEYNDNCLYWWFYNYTAAYNVKTYLTKINSNLNIVWHNQLTDNYMHIFDIGYQYYQLFNIYPTIIDVLDDVAHSINIIHQVKSGYDLANQLKLERYDASGNQEFEKILLDSLQTAEACNINISFAIQRWKDQYICENSKNTYPNYIEKIKFNLEGDTNELKQFSDNSYFNPFTLYSFYYSKDFTKAGNDIYKVFSSAIGLGSSSQKWLPNYKRK